MDRLGTILTDQPIRNEARSVAKLSDRIEIPDDIPHEEKRRRLHELSAELQQMSLVRNERFVGTEQTVLVEGSDRKEGYLSGKTEGRLIVRFAAPFESPVGEFVTIRIDSVAPLSLEGTFVAVEDPTRRPRAVGSDQ